VSEEVWHGTPGGYTNHKCRCVECAAANTRKQRAYRANGATRIAGVYDRRIEQIKLAPSLKEWKAEL
jgi:hypothetical protein